MMKKVSGQPVARQDSWHTSSSMKWITSKASSTQTRLHTYMTKNQNKGRGVRFAFFGTAPLKDAVLTELARIGYVPQKIVEFESLTPELIRSEEHTSEL